MDDTTLLVPDRPGNKLLFGLQNILENPRVGLCFVIPGNNGTLRVGGRATLTKDPAVLAQLSARKIDALLAIRVEVCAPHAVAVYGTQEYNVVDILAFPRL